MMVIFLYFLPRLFELSDDVRVGSLIRDFDRLGFGIGFHHDGREKLLTCLE